MVFYYHIFYYLYYFIYKVRMAVFNNLDTSNV
jgi:hypothetical protein